MLDIFNLPEFSERTLYRVLETLGNNHETIISDIQDRLFARYDFEHTNINMDWTGIVLHGDKSVLGKYGYSRDHRADKKQITLGICELADSINVPTGITVEKGIYSCPQSTRGCKRKITLLSLFFMSSRKLSICN